MFFSFIHPTAKVNNVSVEKFYKYVTQVFTVQAYFLPAKIAHLHATMTCAYGLREMKTVLGVRRITEPVYEVREIKIVLGVRRIIEPVCGFREIKIVFGVRRNIEPVCGFRERKTLHRRRYSWYLFLLEVE
jgi:hypothetical protein